MEIKNKKQGNEPASSGDVDSHNNEAGDCAGEVEGFSSVGSNRDQRRD